MDRVITSLKRGSKLRAAFTEEKVEKEEEEAPWLSVGIVVSVMDKSIKDGSLFKKKAVVKELNGFAGIVEMVSGERLKID